MNNIPNQSNLNDVVSSILSNNETATTLIKSVSNVINTIEKIDVKRLKKNSNSFTLVSNIISDYTKSLSKIIANVGTKINGNNLTEVLGFVAEQKDLKTGEIIKKQQFTVLEAITQLSTVFTNISESIFKLADHKFKKSEIKRLSKNITSLINIVTSSFLEIVNSLGNSPSKDFKELLSVLISEPDTINKIVTSKDTSYGDHKNIDEKIEEKTQKGKIGVLDMLVKFFEILGSVVTLQIPNKRHIKKFKKELTDFTKELFDTILSIANQYATDDNLKIIEKFSGEKGLLGSTNDETGINGVVSSITNMAMSMEQIDLKKSKKISENLIKYFSDFLKQLNVLINGNGKEKSIIYKVTGENVNKTFEALTTTLNSFSSVVETITEISLLKLTLKSKIFKLGFKSLRFIINAITDFTSDEQLLEKLKSLNDFDTSYFDSVDVVVQSINSLTQSIIDLSKNIMILGLLFIPLALLYIPAIWTIKLSIEVVNKINDTLRKLNQSKINYEKSIDKIKSINDVIEALVRLSKNIILFGFLSILLIPGSVLAIMGVLLILETVWTINKLLILLGNPVVTKEVLESINDISKIFIKLTLMMVMVGALIILMAATVDLIKDKIINIILFFAMITVITAIIIALGFLLSKVSLFMGVAMVAIGQLLVLTLMIVAIGAILVKISKFEIDKEDLKTKISDIIEVANLTVKTILDSFDVNNIKSIRKAKRYLRVVKNSIRHIVKIAQHINKLKDIKISPDDKSNIETIVDLVISTANTTVDKIMGSFKSRKDMRHRVREARKTKKFLSPIIDSTAMLNDIADNLNKIQEYKDKLNQTDIDASIDTIITIVNTTIIKIFDVVKKADLTRQQMRKRIKQANKTEKFLSPIVETTAMLNDIADNLNKIQEYKDKLNQDAINKNIEVIASAANNTITQIFAVIEKADNTNETMRQKITKKSMNQKVKQANKTEDFLAPISSSIGLIGGIADSLNKINKEVKFTKEDKETIKSKVTSIIEVTNSSLSTIASNNDFVNNAKKLSDSSSGLFSGFDSFVQSTNKLDLTKLKETNGLFTSMTKFSESVNGNFNTLAETLTEKIAPVLEELKELLGEIPDRIDANASNVSSSIFANSVNKPNDKPSMVAQVQRENNSLSNNEAEAEAEKRMQEKATEDAQSIEVKLDELIELLRSGQIQIKLG